MACSLSPALDEAQAEHARQRMAESLTAREGHVAARRAAMAQAEEVMPGTEPCPIAVPAPSGKAGSTASMEEAVAMARGARMMSERLEQVVRAEELRSSTGPAIQVQDRERQRVEELLADPLQGSSRDLESLPQRADALIEPPGWDVVLLARLTTAPLAAGDAFQAGSMAGRVLVYSYHEARIVCVADAVADSSGQVTVVRTEIGGAPIASTPLSDAAALHQDLVVNLLRAAIPQLKAVAPAGGG